MAYDTTSTSGYGTGGSGSRTVTAFFDSRADADEAVQDLATAGVSRSNIRVVEGAGGGTSGSSATSYEHKGFWDSLADLFLPDEDRYTYAEGLRRGGYLVTVDLRDSSVSYDRVIEILDREGAIDLDERESSWRSEGWTRDTSTYGGYATGSSASTRSSDYSDTAAGVSSSSTGTGSGYAATGGISGGGYASTTGTSGNETRTTSDYGTRGTTAGVNEEGVIEVAEEQLRVGKREVGGGRVRVRSYVVETPVSEDVSLREERVHLERRPVDRPATGSDMLFRDKTIEVEERREEAVVDKQARVVEEIAVGKDVETRTQTVSDTVRRTEVEVEDERGTRIGGTTTGGTTSSYDESLDAERRRKL